MPLHKRTSPRGAVYATLGSILATGAVAPALTGCTDAPAPDRLYEQQRDYEWQAEQVGALVYTTMLNDGFDAMLHNYANLNTVISTFWYRECELLAAYTDTFTALGDTAAADTTALPEMCRRIRR